MKLPIVQFPCLKKMEIFEFYQIVRGNCQRRKGGESEQETRPFIWGLRIAIQRAQIVLATRKVSHSCGEDKRLF